MSNPLDTNNLQDTYYFRFFYFQFFFVLDELGGTLACDNSLTLPKLSYSTLQIF